MNTDYSTKLNEEISRYEHVTDIHQLPGIHHYWSSKYLLPMIQTYGFNSINEIYGFYMKEACENNPQEILHFISIGAGNCELEVELATYLANNKLSNFIFECLDINQSMLDRGKSLAKEHGVEELMQFKAEDLNYWEVPYTYDIIIAAQCLHHFIDLEEIFEKIHKFLSPNGYFITHDMIGRNGHMRWPEALAYLNEFWKELPEKYKYNHQLQRQESKFLDWDCSTVGFEGIRSQDILPLLVKKFNFELFIPWGGIIDVFTDRSFGHNFNPESTWDLEFIDRVQHLNVDKLMSGHIKPTQMIAAMTKKPNPRRLYWQGLTPEFCVRRIESSQTVNSQLTTSSIPSFEQSNYGSFVFTHIPKCAGTSFREYIYNTAKKNLIPEEKIYIPGFGGLHHKKNVTQLSKKELEAFREKNVLILADHCKYNIHLEKQLNLKDPFYYTILREPVSRFISHYNYFYRFLGFENLKDIDLNHLDKDILQNLLMRFSNMQLAHIKVLKRYSLSRIGRKTIRRLSSGKFFKPGSPGRNADSSWVKEAMLLLKEEYGAFGIIEEIDLSLKFLQKKAPQWLTFDSNTFPKRNEGPAVEQDQPVDIKIIELIKHHNRFDIQLYRQALDLLHEKAVS